MALSASDLIEKAKEQRRERRYAEAVVSAQSATQAEPNNADAWWQLALCFLATENDAEAMPALRSTTELAPGYAYGWTLYGTTLLRMGKPDLARAAFERAIEENPDEVDALSELANIYEKVEDEDAELKMLERLERLKRLPDGQLNRIGILYHRKKNFIAAISYYKRFAKDHADPAGLFNLGLVYRHPEVSQDADAIDIWRLAKKRYPTFERSEEEIEKTIPRLLSRLPQINSQPVTLLGEAEKFRYYVNPFEILNLHPETALPPDAKIVQRLKRALLQEIDLEDGRISWMENAVFDKSRLIGLIEEVNNPSICGFHWSIFLHKSLMNFLSRGEHKLFVVDQQPSPLETIEMLDNPAFAEWLSLPFARQYNLVLGKVIEQKNTTILECLMDGRCWVSPVHLDLCFDTAKKILDASVDPLRKAEKSAEQSKPNPKELARILDQHGLIDVLNKLPMHFGKHQNEVVGLLRSIAISAYNTHGDTDISKDILNLCNKFTFVPPPLRERLEADFTKIDELIGEERKDEVKLVSGEEEWEITKEGARRGAKFISADSVSGMRWGSIVSQGNYDKVYDFLVVIKDDKGGELRFDWKVYQDVEKHKKFHQNLFGAAISYLLPTIVRKIEGRLKDGRPVQIGPCLVTGDGLHFQTKGWFSTKEQKIPWGRAETTVANGDLIVFDSSSPKVRVAMPLHDTDNAVVIQLMSNRK